MRASEDNFCLSTALLLPRQPQEPFAILHRVSIISRETVAGRVEILSCVCNLSAIFWHRKLLRV